MDIIIRNSGGVPIYDQITRQMKGLILRGELKEGEALPSMRLLAKELRISVITTKRAYDELEAQGLIDTVAGKGCFVAEKNLDVIREQQLRELEEDGLILRTIYPVIPPKTDYRLTDFGKSIIPVLNAMCD